MIGVGYQERRKRDNHNARDITRERVADVCSLLLHPPSVSAALKSRAFTAPPPPPPAGRSLDGRTLVASSRRRLLVLVECATSIQVDCGCRSVRLGQPPDCDNNRLIKIRCGCGCGCGVEIVHSAAMDTYVLLPSHKKKTNNFRFRDN